MADITTILIQDIDTGSFLATRWDLKWMIKAWMGSVLGHYCQELHQNETNCRMENKYGGWDRTRCFAMFMWNFCITLISILVPDI